VAKEKTAVMHVESQPLDTASTPKPKAKKNYRPLFIGAAFLLALVAFLSYIGVLGGNVRVVDAGRFYRSAQLTGNGYDAVSARLAGNSLDAVVKRYGIHTVISLRNGSDKDRFYREEKAVCAKEGVDHVDVPFSALHLPPPETLSQLLATLDHARYPVIVHCQAGSDRTGLASTLYVHLYRHVPLNEAQAEELTWHYGHFPVQKTRRMDLFFDLFRKTGAGMDLRTWIDRKYPALYASSPDK
jgi:protein tyrosine phosphatase (PTP) superfamily phosphohydrolase (DUF442 family)